MLIPHFSPPFYCVPLPRAPQFKCEDVPPGAVLKLVIKHVRTGLQIGSEQLYSQYLSFSNSQRYAH
jgi:uncharacterized protein YqfA (UPF0365 family)